MKLLITSLLKKSRLITTLFFFIIFLNIFAQSLPEPMYPFRLVNDFANLFSPNEKNTLEQKLLAYYDSTSTQIYVVTIDDLQGYPPSEYAFRIGEKWGIGQRKKDNGLLILIKPPSNNTRGEAFIATGYGLEAFVNDAYAGRVVRNTMLPYFKDGDYFEGVSIAVDQIVERLSGQFEKENDEENKFPFWIIALIVIVVVMVIALSSKDGGGNNIGGGGKRRTSFGRSVFFPSYGGGRSPWSGGGGSRGSRGFGGGGGGRFGGGGAGASW